MTTREHINEYFNGRPFVLLSALILVAMTFIALSMGVKPIQIGGAGIFFPFKGLLMDNGPLSAAVNVLCLLTTGFIMLALNKVFNYVRSVTHLFVSVFFLLQAANPAALLSFNLGTLLCLVTAVSILPMFASFQDRHAQRSIFLIFAMVAAGSMFHYGFLALIPAFLLGFMNMRVFNLKGFFAMLIGLVTPFWIVLGLGIAKPDDFVMPQINGIWTMINQPQVNLLVTLGCATAVLGIVLATMNLFTIMNYRMQTRVYNIVLIIILVVMTIAKCLNYLDMTVYMPLLNLMVAVQVAQAHTLHTTNSRRYLLMLLLVAACLAFAVTNLMMT